MPRHVIAGTGQPYPDIKKLQTGDIASFHRLYQQFYEELAMKAASLLNEKEEAATLVTHCFIKCWLKCDILTSINYIAAFLTTTVRNNCMAGNKGQGFRSPHYANVLDTVLSDSIRNGFSRAELFARINVLPLSQFREARAVFGCLYVQDTPITEKTGETGLAFQDTGKDLHLAFQVLHLILSTENI